MDKEDFKLCLLFPPQSSNALLWQFSTHRWILIFWSKSPCTVFKQKCHHFPSSSPTKPLIPVRKIIPLGPILANTQRTIKWECSFRGAKDLKDCLKRILSQRSRGKRVSGSIENINHNWEIPKLTAECRGLLVPGETQGGIGDTLQRQDSSRGEAHLSYESKSYEKVPDLIEICPNHPFPFNLRLKSNYTQHEKRPGGI